MIWRMGAVIACAVFVIDRVSKWWLIERFDLPTKGTVKVFSFFDLTMVWNKGISLGLFQSGDEIGRIILIGLTGVVSVVIAFWLYRASNRLVAVALGFVLGGAIGNIWDRIQYGAVADFLHFHISGWSFYVFNVADSAITLGVMLLLLDALLSSQKEPT